NNDKSLAETAADETGITSYNFTNSQTGVLENLGSGATTLIGPNKSNVTSDVTPIGFNFVFMGKVYNSFSVNTNGVLRFGDDPVVPDANTFGIPGNDRIAVFALSSAAEDKGWWIFPDWRAITPPNLKTHTNGTIHYKVMDVAPNRYIVIEWKNMQVPTGSG